MALTTQQQTDLYKLGVGMFGASLGTTYMNQLANQVNAGVSVSQLYDILANSPAFQALNFGFTNAATNTQFATAFVDQLVGSTLSTANRTWAIDWVKAQLDAGVSRGQVMKTAVDALDAVATTDANFGNAAARLDNRVTVARNYTEVQNGSAISVSTLQNTIASVDNTQASVDAAIAANASAAGQTFTLTTGADNFTGTTATDTFNALVDGTTATNTTISASDQLNGSSGTDTLNITFQGGAVATGIPAASISNIETINVRAVGTGAVSGIDLSLIPGVTALNADRSTQAVTVTKLASGATAGMIGDGTASNAAFNAGWADAATASTLNISGGTTGGAVTLSGAGLTSTTVNSTGASNTIGALTLAATTTTLTIDASTKLTTGAVTNTTAPALTTLNVKGAGAVDISAGTLESTVTKIDASENTGGLTVKLGSAVTQTVTGSKGNDVITTGAVLTTGSVNAGDGTDTLDVGANVSHVNTSSLAAKYTNFETLRVNGTLDASLISGITKIELSGATNSITKMSATQAGAVTARANIGDSTLALSDSSGTSDVLNLTMGRGGSGTSAATTAGALTVNGFETLNITAAAGSTATAGANRTSTIGSFVADKATAINLKGTAVTLSNAATTKAVTIDASALTGDGASTPVGLTISGSLTAGSAVTGSAVKDVMTVGAEGSKYDGGAGNDTFSTTAAILNADGTTDATLVGGAGTDTLTLTGALTVTDVHFTNVSGMEKLDSAATTAVSYTGLGAGFKAAFADGVTITTGTLADNATYTVGLGLYDKAVTLTLTSSGVGDTTADNIAITTGTAADTVTVTAASWVGHATTNGSIVISTGASADTVSLTTGTLLANANAGQLVQIVGGTGADAITVSHTNAGAGTTGMITFTVAAGDSTTTAYDSVTGFKMSDIGGTDAKLSDALDFAAVGLTTYAATAATGFAAAELTVAVSATGVVTFAGTSAANLTLAQKISAVQSVVTTNNGDTAMFTHGGNTYVFNNNTTSDSVIELVGVTGSALITTNDVTTDNGIFIV